MDQSGFLGLGNSKIIFPIEMTWSLTSVSNYCFFLLPILYSAGESLRLFFSLLNFSSLIMFLFWFVCDGFWWRKNKKRRWNVSDGFWWRILVTDFGDGKTTNGGEKQNVSDGFWWRILVTKNQKTEVKKQNVSDGFWWRILVTDFFKAPFELLFKGKAGQKKSALEISARKSAEQNTSSCPACGSLLNPFSDALCHCCRACKSQGSLFLS